MKQWEQGALWWRDHWNFFLLSFEPIMQTNDSLIATSHQGDLLILRNTMKVPCLITSGTALTSQLQSSTIVDQYQTVQFTTQVWNVQTKLCIYMELINGEMNWLLPFVMRCCRAVHCREVVATGHFQHRQWERLQRVAVDGSGRSSEPTPNTLQLLART